MPGLLIDGREVVVPNVTVINVHDDAGASMSPGDGYPRTNRPQQITLHKTIADDPEQVRAGKGPVGHALRVAQFWKDDPQHSGATLVAGDDGIVACLADCVRWMSYHARSVNPYSIGMEICEQPGGIVYQAALDSAVEVVIVLARECGIQLQYPKIGTYNGNPRKRMAHPGAMFGVFGHRDNDDNRGKWDPGDIVFEMLGKRVPDAMAFDFDKGEDLGFWKDVQSDLSRKGHKIVVDGLPGPGTTAALKLEGYVGGVLALGKNGQH